MQSQISGNFMWHLQNKNSYKVSKECSFILDSMDENYLEKHLFEIYQNIARELRCAPAQLALAWLLYKAPHIIPIPGTTSVDHLLEDLASVNLKLAPEDLAQLEALINQTTVAGNRYGAQANSEVDTETF